VGDEALTKSSTSYGSVFDALGPARAPNCSTSSCSPTSSAPTGSAPIGEPNTRTFAELLIDCEEDRTLRAVLVGMLQEHDRNA
jgi:hypothetical protein